MSINNGEDKRSSWLMALKLVIRIVTTVSLFLVFSSFFFRDFDTAKILLFFIVFSSVLALGLTIFTKKIMRVRDPVVIVLVISSTALILHLTTNTFYRFKGIYRSFIPNSITDVALNILSPAKETENPTNETIDSLASSLFIPERPTYLIENRPDFPVLNSITNNMIIGDERDFFRVRKFAGSDSEFLNEISLEPGKQYTGLLYYYNDGQESLNNVSNNTKISVTLPSVINSKKTSFALSTIKSDNSVPQNVSDKIILKNETGGDVALRYVPDSAKIITNGQINGAKINFDELAGSGLSLGFDVLDGALPPGEWYGGYIIFDFKVDQPDFVCTLEASFLTTERRWAPYTFNLGEENTAEVRIRYWNTGTTEQRDVILKLVLPEGFTYIEGSSKLANHNTGWEYREISDNLSTDTGINIGHYSAGAEAYAKAKFKVDSDFFEQGGWFKRSINSLVITKNGTKQQDIEITFINPEVNVSNN